MAKDRLFPQTVDDHSLDLNYPTSDQTCYGVGDSLRYDELIPTRLLCPFFEALLLQFRLVPNISVRALSSTLNRFLNLDRSPIRFHVDKAYVVVVTYIECDAIIWFLVPEYSVVCLNGLQNILD